LTATLVTRILTIRPGLGGLGPAASPAAFD
jgi:hypothetical protein